MDTKATAKHLKALIADNQLEQAIDEMLTLLQSTGGEGENVLIALRGRKSKLDSEVAKGIISKESEDLESNMIRDTLLNFADQIGKDKKANFITNLPSKELVEHDRKIFKKWDRLIDYDFLLNLKLEFKKNNSFSDGSFATLKKVQQVFRNPTFQYLVLSISYKNQPLEKTIESILMCYNEIKIKKLQRKIFFKAKSNLNVTGTSSPAIFFLINTNRVIMPKDSIDVLKELYKSGVTLDNLDKKLDTLINDLNNSIKDLENSLMNLIDEMISYYYDFRMEVKQKLII